MKVITYFFFVLFSINSLFVFAQYKSAYIWFDDEIGVENTSLFNGAEFTDTYNLLDKDHRFFKTDAFISGSINYNNQDYFEIDLKYDLYQDQLIVKLVSNNGEISQILLLKEKIERFKIGRTKFEKLNDAENIDNFSQGFYEVLEENKHLKLYKKNRKKLKKVIKNNSVYYRFIEEKPEYIIFTDGNFYKINKKRDLVSIFPEFKKEIIKFNWTSRNFAENDKQLTLAIKMIGQALYE